MRALNIFLFRLELYVFPEFGDLGFFPVVLDWQDNISLYKHQSPNKTSRG